MTTNVRTLNFHKGLPSMRFETDHFVVNAASHIGHFHRDKGVNCQDNYGVAVFPDNSPEWIAGVVCDGCGGADIDTPNGVIECKSEVGSALVSEFILRQLRLSINDGKPLQETVAYLFEATKRYIMNSIYFMSTAEIAYHVQRYWLCTIRGFVMSPTEGYLFSAGDGWTEVVYLDEAHGYPVTFADHRHDEAPHYLSYGCIPNPGSWNIPKKLVLDAFHTHPFEPAKVNKLFVATDGFETHCDRKLITYESAQNCKLPRTLLNEQWGKKGKTGLKRWLNMYFDKGYFDDDVAIITVERKHE